MPPPDRYAVFGKPISHSKSPRIHRLFAEQCGQLIDYRAQEVSAAQFNAAVSAFFANGGKGLNCTIPLKEPAWAYAARRSERAERSKAVNTLALLGNGNVYGDNTDGSGLVRDLTVNHGLDLQGRRLLILGAGGAARGILYPLLEQVPEALIIANRTPGKAVQLAAEFQAGGRPADGRIEGCGFADLAGRRFDLIINATAASLTGELPPLPDTLLIDDGCCYDLAYADAPTPFVLWGKRRNARKSLDGLGMLVEQAADAFALWRGVRPQTAPILRLLNAERHLSEPNVTRCQDNRF